VSYDTFGGFSHDHFEFLARPVTERTWEQQARLKTQMLSLEHALADGMSPEQRLQLGETKVGRLELEARSAWMQTHDGTDGVNLTVELWGAELQLDLVAWRLPQATVFRSWLATPGGADRLRALEGFEIVVFTRRANQGPSGEPYWRRERFADVARVAARYPDALRAVIASLDRAIDPKWEKLAFHVRRSWPRQKVVDAGAEILEAVRPRLLAMAPLVREINGQLAGAPAVGA
jgi:hypothetical protein